MLFSKVLIHTIRLALALVLGLTIIGSIPISAQAQTSVDLELGGEGATSWTIINIKPGDSGTKTVTLHNAGYRDGLVTIWISDIEEVDYGGNGAALDDYLLFNLSSDRLSTNLVLPATIHELPQGATATNYIKMDRLYAGETATLIWQWVFPETGQSQNDAQGDSLSFTVNYLLEELPSGNSGDDGTDQPSYQWIRIEILNQVTMAKVSSSGKLLDSYVASDPDNKNKLQIENGTRITCISGGVPIKIEMIVGDSALVAPEGAQLIGPTYELIGYTRDSVPCDIIFDKPLKLTLSYDAGWLPTNTSSLNIGYYNVQQGWIYLEPSLGSVTELGKVTTSTKHTSTFAILAKLAPESSPVQSPPESSPPTPAEFILSELAINPTEVEIGKSVTVSIVVQNTGEHEGTYTLALKINGEIEQSKEITLSGGEGTQVSFIVVRDTPGTYTVAADDLSGQFAVLVPIDSPSWISTYWWVMLLSVLTVGVMAYYLMIRFRHHA